MSQIFFIFVCFWLAYSSSLQAEGTSKGLDAYRDGSYAKAYKYLSKVAKKAKNKSEKASAIAMMGASAVKMNKNGKAKILFVKALKLDSEVTLIKEAAKDKSVDKIFSQAKNSSSEDSDSSAGSSGTGNPIMSLIPGGIGFFMAGKTTKGIIYGGLQAAGLIGYIVLGSEITKANKEAEAVGSQILADKAANKAIDPISLKFLDDNEKFVKTTQGTQTLMLGLLIAGYGLGVVDGFVLSRSSDGSKTSISKPNRLKKSMAEADQGSDDQTRKTEPSWNLKLQPWPDQSGVAAALTLNRNF